jgi:hypothetical protein
MLVYLTTSLIVCNWRLEEWTARGSFGMSTMFVALLPSFYNFLIGSDGNGSDQLVFPFPVQMQIMSISAIPGIILAGVAFRMSSSYGSKLSGIILIAAGVIMVAGMIIEAS